MSSIILHEGVAPPTPDAGKVAIYPLADGQIYSKDDAGAESALSLDEKSKVSANDTTAGFLNGKLVSGAGIQLTENNNGGNETLTIASTITNTDELAKVSANDTTAGYLNGKLVAGTNITLVENNNGGNETLTISASGGGSSFNPATSFEIYEDWVTGNEDSDEMGAYGWRTFNNGTGTLPTRLTGEAGRPGIIRLSSGTTASTRSSISLGDSSAINSLILGSGEIIFETSIRIVGTLTLFARAQFGLGDSPNTNGLPVNGVFFDFNPGGLETTIRLASVSASTATRNDLSQTIVSGTWYRLRFVVNTAASSVQAYINGSSVGSAITTNIPTAGISPFLKLDGIVGGSQIAGDIDYVYLTQSGLTR